MHKRTIHKEQVARWEAAGCVAAAAADDVSNTAEEPQLARGGGGLRGGLEHSFFANRGGTVRYHLSASMYSLRIFVSFLFYNT